MMRTRQVELEFVGARVTREVEIGVLANDDVTVEVAVEVARSRVVENRPDIGRFRAGRVIA